MRAIVKAIGYSSGQWLGISLILVLAAALYLYRLGAQSLWIDELYSIYDAGHMSIVALLTETSRPLYYLLLKFWSQFGGSEFWLRAMSIPFSLGSVFLTYQLGQRVAGRAVGLWASLFLCLSPLVIDHTQEVRFYAVSIFLGLVGAIALTRAFETPSHGRIAGWAVARILVILNTPVNLSLLVTDLVLIGVRFHRDRSVLTAFAKWLLLVAVLCFPTMLHFSTEGTEVMTTGWITEIPKPDIQSICGRLVELVVGRGYSHNQPFLVLFSLLSLVLLATGLLDRRKSTEFRYVAAWAIIPISISLLVSFLSSSTWNVPRYQMMLVPYLFIILGNGLVWYWHKRKAIGVALALAYFTAVVGGLATYYYGTQRQNWRGMFAVINKREAAGDVVVICANNLRPHVAAAYYHKGSSPVCTVNDRSWQPKLNNILSSFSAAPSQSRLWLIYKGNRAGRIRLRGFLGERWRFRSERLTARRGGGPELFLVSK